MSIAKNDLKLESQLEQLTLPDSSKYLEEVLDDALVTAMRGDQKAFCLKIESHLNEFMKSQKSTDKLLNLDKFQRKIVHKICDVFFIKRDYVDVKSDDTGDITITKTEQSKLPERSLEGNYKKYMEDRTRATQKVVQTLTSSNPQKIMIKKKPDSNAPPQRGFQIAKKESKTDASGNLKEGQSHENEDEAKEDSDLERRKAEYEVAKNRIFDTSSEAQQSASDPSQKSQSKKKAISTNEFYDPAFDRTKTANHILLQQMQTNTDNTMVDPNLGGYGMMFPQLGGPMNMNPYGNYGPMNQFPPMMMNQYPMQMQGPVNMMGFPYQIAPGYPQQNPVQTQNTRPSLQKKGSKE
jgi:hypothetical protein